MWALRHVRVDPMRGRERRERRPATRHFRRAPNRLESNDGAVHAPVELPIRQRASAATEGLTLTPDRRTAGDFPATAIATLEYSHVGAPILTSGTVLAPLVSRTRARRRPAYLTDPAGCSRGTT